MSIRPFHAMRNMYERVRYGAGCCDVFNLDAYMAKHIARWLKAFRRREMVGYSMESSEAWEAAIDEMIWAFETYDAGYDEPFDVDAHLARENRRQKALELFGKYYGSLWK